MTLTDAQRRANNKYIAKATTVLGCKMRRDAADEFKAACKAAGTTPNAVFRAAIDDFMAQAQEPAQPTSAAPEGQEEPE